MGLGPLTVSLSEIVTVVVNGVPNVAPETLFRLTVNVSLPSAYESSTIGTENVCEVSPAANCTLPITFV